MPVTSSPLVHQSIGLSFDRLAKRSRGQVRPTTCKAVSAPAVMRTYILQTTLCSPDLRAALCFTGCSARSFKQCQCTAEAPAKRRQRQWHQQIQNRCVRGKRVHWGRGHQADGPASIFCSNSLDWRVTGRQGENNHRTAPQHVANNVLNNIFLSTPTYFCLSSFTPLVRTCVHSKPCFPHTCMLQLHPLTCSPSQTSTHICGQQQMFLPWSRSLMSTGMK